LNGRICGQVNYIPGSKNGSEEAAGRVMEFGARQMGGCFESSRVFEISKPVNGLKG